MALGLASPGPAWHTANLRSSSPFLRSCTRCARPDGGGRRLAQARGWAGNRGSRNETLGDDDIVGWNWTGSDEFTPLNDRRDEPPLPLPRLSSSRRIVLVRHGQSTWNARNRIQGSSDFSVLTDLGVEQATVTQKRLAGMDFQCMFYSPLKRAAQTSEIVWGGRSAPAVKLPSLREIDLYSFQGLDKVDRRVLYAQEYKAWQGTPAEFLIDGHAPVRELWYRASLAWQHILLSELQPQCSLVVAHNAVNQALLCTALGLPPPFFRRFAQTNGAFTVLDFKYSGPEGSQRVPVQPTVQVERMNQFPSRPLNPSKTGKSTPKRLVLICGEAASPAVQAALTLLASNGADVPPLLGIGSTAQQVLDISTAVQAALSTPGEGRVVTAVACAEACQLLLGACLGAVVPGVGQEQGTTARDAGEVGRLFHMTEGGITIVNWMPGQHEMSAGIVLCVNYLDTGGSSRSTKEAVADARARDAQATTNAAA